MEFISATFITYIIILILACVSGSIFWVIGKYRTCGVISIIFSLLAPLFTLIIIAQRSENVSVMNQMWQEIVGGNTLARMNVTIHLYLLAWMIFLLVLLIIAAKKNNLWKEQITKFIINWKKKLKRFNKMLKSN